MHEPKFKLGQRVCVVDVICDKEVAHVPCIICWSTGIVKIQGYEFQCPQCHGETKSIETFEYVIFKRNARILAIDSFICLPEFERNEDCSTPYLEYIVEVGPKQYCSFPDYLVFATEDEAQDFCDKCTPLDETGAEAVSLKL